MVRVGKFCELVHVMFIKQAQFANHPAQTSGGIGPAAEPEQIDFIAFFVVIGDEPVPVAHICRQPDAERTGDSVPTPGS